MKYEWFDDYLLEKKGVTKDFQPDWDAFRYFVGGKIIAMIGKDNKNKGIFTIKCNPEFGLMLRNEYKDISPGYYMNKVHWNSVFHDGDVPDKVLKQMIDNSYDLIFKSLTKKVQKQIEEE